MGEIVITEASTNHLEPVMAVISAALAEDPGWSIAVTEREVRCEAIRRLVRAGASLTANGAGKIFVALDAGTVVGAAICMAPGTMPLTPSAYAKTLPRWLPFALRHPRDMRRTFRFVTGIEAQFPADPVHYLEWLGVEPAMQGQGIGAALLQRMMAEGDKVERDSYLETQNPRNVAYYEGFGFRLLSSSTLFEGGPESWYMRRTFTPAGNS